MGRSADSAIYLCFRNIHQSLSRSKTSQPPFVDTEKTISPKIPSLSRGIPYLSEVGPPSLEYRKESLFKSTLFTIKSFCPSMPTAMSSRENNDFNISYVVRLERTNIWRRAKVLCNGESISCIFSPVKYVSSCRVEKYSRDVLHKSESWYFKYSIFLCSYFILWVFGNRFLSFIILKLNNESTSSSKLANEYCVERIFHQEIHKKIEKPHLKIIQSFQMFTDWEF